jgi:hypothetical protein
MLFRLWQRARRGSILEYGALLVVDGPKARIVTAVEHDHEAGGGMLDKHQKACPAHPATWWRTRANGCGSAVESGRLTPSHRRVSTLSGRASSSTSRSCPRRSVRRRDGRWDVVPRALIH